jgi:hypothetical protein
VVGTEVDARPVGDPLTPDGEHRFLALDGRRRRRRSDAGQIADPTGAGERQLAIVGGQLGLVADEAAVPSQLRRVLEDDEVATGTVGAQEVGHHIHRLGGELGTVEGTVDLVAQRLEAIGDGSGQQGALDVVEAVVGDPQRPDRALEGLLQRGERLEVDLAVPRAVRSSSADSKAPAASLRLVRAASSSSPSWSMPVVAKSTARSMSVRADRAATNPATAPRPSSTPTAVSARVMRPRRGRPVRTSPTSSTGDEARATAVALAPVATGQSMYAIGPMPAAAATAAAAGLVDPAAARAQNPPAATPATGPPGASRAMKRVATDTNSSHDVATVPARAAASGTSVPNAARSTRSKGPSPSAPSRRWPARQLGRGGDPDEGGRQAGRQRWLHHGEHRHRERSGDDGDEQHGELTPHRHARAGYGGAVASAPCASS